MSALPTHTFRDVSVLDRAFQDVSAEQDLFATELKALFEAEDERRVWARVFDIIRITKQLNDREKEQDARQQL